jgi:hypothetical protein
LENLMNEEIATAEEVNAAFESGASDEQPAISTPDENEQKPEVTPATATPPPAPQESSALTPEILAALSSLPNLEKRLTQQVDRVTGNYGEVKRLLDTMQKANTTTPQGAADAADAWDELKAEFPELADPISKAVGKMMGTRQGINPDEVRAMVSEAMGGQSVDLAVLDELHPEWKELKANPPAEYQEWLDSLKPASRMRYLKSNDPLHVAEKLDEFDAWRTTRTATAAPTAPTTETHQASTSRLEAAATPSGRSRGSPTTLSAADAFLQAAGEA